MDFTRNKAWFVTAIAGGVPAANTARWEIVGLAARGQTVTAEATTNEDVRERSTLPRRKRYYQLHRGVRISFRGCNPNISVQSSKQYKQRFPHG